MFHSGCDWTGPINRLPLQIPSRYVRSNLAKDSHCLKILLYVQPIYKSKLSSRLKEWGFNYNNRLDGPLAVFEFESEECAGCLWSTYDFPSEYLTNALLCVPVSVSNSVSSYAVTAGCLANISASIILSVRNDFPSVWLPVSPSTLPFDSGCFCLFFQPLHLQVSVSWVMLLFGITVTLYMHIHLRHFFEHLK